MAVPTKIKLQQLKLKAERVKHEHTIAKAKDELRAVKEQQAALKPRKE